MDAGGSSSETFDIAWPLFAAWPIGFVLLFVLPGDIDTGLLAFIVGFTIVASIVQFGFFYPWRIVLDADEIHLHYLLRGPRDHFFHEIDSAAKFRLSIGWLFWLRNGRRMYFLGPWRGSPRLRRMLAERGVDTGYTWFGFRPGSWTG